MLVVPSHGLSVDARTLEHYCGALADGLGLPVAVGSADDIAAGDAVVRVDDGPEDSVDDVAALARVDLRAPIGVHDRSGCVVSVRGRGIDGIRWAVRALIARTALPPATEPYGPLPDQFGDLRLPAAPGPRPVVVLVHGGGWRECWERDLMDDLAVDLTRRGYATWNLEYRRVGPSGGGWPQSVDDVRAGIDALASLARRHPLDVGRVALLAHSAGVQLGVSAAARHGSVGIGTIVALSGAVDFEQVAARGTGDGAALDFMGGRPEELPDAYAAASPLALLPLPTQTQLVAYGTLERVDLIDGNRRYCARAREVGNVEELVIPGADHFSVIDPRTPGWEAIAGRIERLFASD